MFLHELQLLLFARIPPDSSITLYFEQMRRTGKHPYMFWPSLVLHHQGPSSFEVRGTTHRMSTATHAGQYVLVQSAITIVRHKPGSAAAASRAECRCDWICGLLCGRFTMFEPPGSIGRVC